MLPLSLIHIYDVSPDGKWIALSAGTTPPPYRERENADVYLISVDQPDSAWRNLTADNSGRDGNPRFTADGDEVEMCIRDRRGASPT